MTEAHAQVAIPRWMIALNIITLAILAFKAWACFFAPDLLFGVKSAYEAADAKALWELGGRNIAMIALGLYALLRPSRGVYLALFIVALFREGADMIFAAIAPPRSAASMLQAATFLIFLVPYGVALRRLHA